MSMRQVTGYAVDPNGNTLGGASVRVGHLASSSPALLYSDEGTTRITNPIIARADGSFDFYTYDGDYSVSVTFGGTTYTLSDMSLDLGHIVYKNADEVINDAVTGATYQNDDDLVFAVRNNEKYHFRMVLYVTTTVAADFKFIFTGPFGIGYFVYSIIDGDGTTVIDNARQAVGAGVVANYTAIPTQIPLIAEGTFTANAHGVFQLQWAQNAATAVDTKVEEYSFIYWCRAT